MLVPAASLFCFGSKKEKYTFAVDYERIIIQR